MDKSKSLISSQVKVTQQLNILAKDLNRRSANQSYNNETMRNSRISPLESIEYGDGRKGKNFGLRRRKGSSSSGSGIFQGIRAKKKKRTFISRNFYQRECFKYFEVKGKNGPQCACGITKDKHPHDFNIITDSTFKWSPEICTRRVPTDSYGEIEFAEDTSTHKPYIRISNDTNALHLLTLMREKWDMEVPNLVISVTGGAKSFHLKPRLKEVFTKGLIKVSVSTGAWIITGGTNTGVMKHVGEAVKHRGNVGVNATRTKINVIGISPWGVIEDSHKLVSKDGEGKYPAEFNCLDFDSTKTGLDYNHSHFLLVDNGTYGQYGTEIELRSRVEEAVAQYLKTESNSDKGAIGIPVVILCLEGGPNTIKTMAEAIKKGTPAVVIDGSGRAADVVAFAYKHLVYDMDRDISYIDPDYEDDIKQKVTDVFGHKSRESVYQEIQQLLKNQNMVTIFRLDDDDSGQSDMDLAILRALLKANKASFQTQLKLALAWNRIDVAKSEIFTEDLKEENFKVEWLYDSLIAALLDNKADFVDLFLTEGVSLRNFITLDVLETLYSGAPSNSALRQVINQNMSMFQSRGEKSSGQVSMNVIGDVMEDLMGDRFKSRYKTDPAYQRPSNTNKFMKKVTSSETFVIPTTAPESEGSVPTPNLDLFTWAVLSHRRELAYLIWKRNRDSIACALMASKLLKTLAERISSNRELADMVGDLLDHSRQYEGFAVGVLEQCRLDNDDLAQTLLVKELPNLGYLTSLDIAVSADNEDFIAQPSCQTLLSRLWMGALYINTELWKVLFGIFNPLMIICLITFREDLDNQDEVDESSTVLSNNNSNIDMEGNLDQTKNGGQSNLLHESLQGSDYSLQRDYYNDSGSEHFELEEAKDEDHTVLDHFEDQDEAVDIAFRKTRTGYFHRVVHFHDTPFVKFTVNVISYVIFLVLYAFIILSRFKISIHPAEYVLQGWVFTLLCEEIRQVLTQEPKHVLGKLEFYFFDPWNKADAISLTAFLVATVLRYVAWDTGEVNYLIAARIIYATDIVLFIIRLLQIFSVNRHMGPKLVMIRKMLDDLVYFVVILAVFVIGYGVAKQAVLYPNSEVWPAIVGVLNRPYWQMYGELFIEDILEPKLNCTTGLPICLQPDAEEPCLDEHGQVVVPIYMAIYMLFTNILLLNLLIAIFNYTFEKVQEDSDKVWKFQRFDLVSEYHNRPALCPPFIFISHFISSFRWLAQKCRCCGCRPTKGSTMRMKLSHAEMEQLSLWEHMAAETFVYESTVKEAETQDERVKSILLKVNSLGEEIEIIKSGEICPTKTEVRPETRHYSRKQTTVNIAGIESRLSKLEHNIEQILELVIQQNQRQGQLLEASTHWFSGSHADTPDEEKTSKKQLLARKMSMANKITSVHVKARMSPYPGTSLQRFKVEDYLVPWEIPFDEYESSVVCYTAPIVLQGPYWADVDLMSMNPRPQIKFNEYDDVNKVNRVSYVGKYEVVDNLPRNPFGRTGIIGRGLLGRFGPNHAADPIATRWKRSSSGIVLDHGKRVLEFIAIQRRDNHQWAIPGGMVEPGQNVSETLRKEFTEEALAKLEMPESKRRQMADKIAYLFRNGVEVYKGYVDDPRNTDNAWMETVACNFHDDSGEVFGELQLQAGDDAQAVRWQRVSGNIPLFASHVGILEKVAQMHGAAFY